MTSILLLVIGFLGAIIGSFANVVALRLHTGRPIVSGRSQCASCGTVLTWYELIPFFSYLFARGKCKTCHSHVSIRYFLVESMFALFFILFFLKESMTVLLVISLVFVTLVGIMVLYDMAHTIIPTELLYPSVLLAGLIVFLRLGFSQQFLFSLAGAAGTALFIFALWFFSRGRAMGFADVPFTFMMALFVGYQLALSGLLLSFYLGAGSGIILLLYRRKHRTMEREMPFAPYLALGFLCVYLFNIHLLPLF